MPKGESGSTYEQTFAATVKAVTALLAHLAKIGYNLTPEEYEALQQHRADYMRRELDKYIYSALALVRTPEEHERLGARKRCSGRP